MNQGKILIAAGIYGFLAVVLGAFGTHSLKNILDPSSLQIFDVGVKYQMYHALALGFVAALAQPSLSKHLKKAALLFSIGILIFSGSLFALIATQVRVLGAITPIGGGLLILGWFFLIREGWDRSQSK
ncbi:MAG: DUF423 domain-containing protein [Pseudomonadota bacterium]